MSLYTRKIGETEVSAIGFGAMGLSGAYGPTKPDEERFKILDAAYEQGCTFWDSSDRYGDNELLIGEWFKRTGKRDEIFLATKFGLVPDADPSQGIVICGTAEYAKMALERSLKRLGVDHIDLWYLHRADPKVPIEITIGAMAEAVKSGKVKYIGISESSEATLRRAHAVHPLSAAQYEYAPFTLDIESPQIGIFNACKELGIALVAYSPLGRGLLTGKLPSVEDMEDGDIRKMIPWPRFQKENRPNIQRLVDAMTAIGKKHGATPAQVSLAWLLAQGENVIPIPGTTNLSRLEENSGAMRVKLTTEEVQEIRDASEKAGAHQIPRTAAMFLHLEYINTPELPK